MEEKEKRKRLILNIAWLVCGGWVCAVLWYIVGGILFQFHLIVAGAFCITIIGAPIGRQYFRMALIAMSPFGVEYEKKELFEPYYPEKY